jgi:DNA-binding CsgD family transcriptional regulator
MKALSFETYHHQVKSALQHAQTVYKSGIDQQSFVAQYSSVLGANQFLTVFDLIDYKYVLHHGLTEVLGYSAEEFTELALIGHGGRTPIIHHEDVPYYLHFGGLLHKVAATAKSPIELMKDYGWFRFRIRAKDGRLFAAHYLSFYFDLHKPTIPRSHIDVWSVVPIQEDARFQTDFGFFASHGFADTKAEFHRLNEEALGLRLTPQQARILSLLRDGLSRKQVAAELSIAEGSVDAHFTQIRTKVNDWFASHGQSSTQLSTAIQLIAFAEKYKLLRDDPFR